ncbi:effector binding domain-containing protein [Paenibacillus kobensis]|uniref:effector binding domain-containing protein n=1 Tax=Paenibacillus kobensis TaxID=59841 RepID=UPI000FD9F8CC|nr:helix-turn-helix domain-containing protein [Paenibacillus kobensis]
MEALRLLKQSLDYIEEHLDRPLEIEAIAKAAMSSKFHFQRMFHALTGFTVTEYIRNRRLTLAAEELAGTDRKVIDIALKYGYDSPEAFAKAFQRLHGVTPTGARRAATRLKAFPRLSFHIQIKGERELNYRIVEEPSYTVVGVDTRVESGQDAAVIPAFVEKIWLDGTHDQVNAAVGRPQGSLLFGYYFDYEEDGAKRYLMGTELPQGSGSVPEDLTTLVISAQTYAVFEGFESMTGEEEIGLEIVNVWRRIYGEWFPSSNFEQVEGTCIEKYYWLDDKQIDSKFEVWVPVRRKD